MNELSIPEQYIRVGKPDVNPEAPSHVAGVHEGNRPHKLLFKFGVRPRELGRLHEPTRSTGIAPKHHVPIDPSMPFLTPP